jgi:hypothetical protein
MIKKNGKEKQSKQLISLKLIKIYRQLYSYSLLPSIIQSRCKIISHQAVTIHWSFNAEISSVNSADNTLRNHFDFKDYEGIFKVQLT